MNNHVIRRGCNGSLLHVKRVLRDPRADQRMEVGVPRNECNKTEATPFVSAVRDGDEGCQHGQRPKCSKEAMEGPLVEILGRVGQGQHGDDLKRGRWSGQEVTLERGEVADTAERECKIGLDRSGGNVGNKTDEVETPHGRVAPGVLDGLPGDGLLQGREALGRVVAQDAVDHDDFFALGVPRLGEQDVLGVCRRGGEIEE